MSDVLGEGMTLAQLNRRFHELGVRRIFFKILAANDNSKNQIYLGGDFSLLNAIPSGPSTKSVSISEKTGKEEWVLKAPLKFSWLTSNGKLAPAPNAQLILYPQYPEVRLSGFLLGSQAKISEQFNPLRQGRSPGRVLFLGVTANDEIIAAISDSKSAIASEVASRKGDPLVGALSELPSDDGLSNLLEQLRRIHRLGWITGKKLTAQGVSEPYNESNGGGYTLEAELGIPPNSESKPDFEGWEVKSVGIGAPGRRPTSAITLMTPEPDGGDYVKLGLSMFVAKYGYADRRGRPGRFNFGGVHKFATPSRLTHLEFRLSGYDTLKGVVSDLTGGLGLYTGDDRCAASWSHEKMLDHWKRKHDRAAFIPRLTRSNGHRSYRFESPVSLGIGTSYSRFVSAFVTGEVYYDPGIKIENEGQAFGLSKKRSQFRVRAGNLPNLYDQFLSQSLIETRI